MSESRFPEDLGSLDEYEEITSEEVDRVVGSLEALIDTVSSENVKAYLDEALNGIYYLIYEDEQDEPAARAA